MSIYRKSLEHFDGRRVSIVGRASTWAGATLCVEHLIVDGKDGVLHEEDHVHVDLLREDVLAIRTGDWIEVAGTVYAYSHPDRRSGATKHNFSIARESVHRLWRGSPQKSREGESPSTAVAYWYATPHSLIPAMRAGRIPALEEHFSSNPQFDRLFAERVDHPETGASEWIGAHEEIWFYRVAIQGPFIDWRAYKNHPISRSGFLRTAKNRKQYYDLIRMSGSRPAEWRFPLSPVTVDRWMSIEAIPRAPRGIRQGEALLHEHYSSLLTE